MSGERTPRTAAGRAFIADWKANRTHPPSTQREREFLTFILAIEAEAAVTSREAGLDAERLAEAFYRTLTSTPRPSRAWANARAATIAAEYARLSSETTDG